jgi:hypothetical protein
MGGIPGVLFGLNRLELLNISSVSYNLYGLLLGDE